MKKKEIMRDAKNWYLKQSNYASSRLINFILQHAGKKILDVGCATGEYCRKLNGLGIECVGVDVNPEYVARAKENGVEAYCMHAESLKFPDNSFDTILLFELLEHVINPDHVLKEAKRVARRNILISVPDCTGFFKLKEIGLTYEHMLEMDHINVFTRKDLESLLSKHFKMFKVEERQPIVLGKIGLPWWLQKPISLLHKLKIIKTDIYCRLFAVVDIERARMFRN